MYANLKHLARLFVALHVHPESVVGRRRFRAHPDGAAVDLAAVSGAVTFGVPRGPVIPLQGLVLLLV